MGLWLLLAVSDEPFELFTTDGILSLVLWFPSSFLPLSNPGLLLDKSLNFFSCKKSATPDFNRYNFAPDHKVVKRGLGDAEKSNHLFDCKKA